MTLFSVSMFPTRIRPREYRVCDVGLAGFGGWTVRMGVVGAGVDGVLVEEGTQMRVCSEDRRTSVWGGLILLYSCVLYNMKVWWVLGALLVLLLCFEFLVCWVGVVAWGAEE
jgi:hypothetical protein